MQNVFEIDIKKKLKFFDLNVKFSMGNELLVIQGLSGSGKTTTLDIISGIKSPDTGSISLKGKVLFSSDSNINIPSRNRKVGYVFQNYALFPHMSVRQNILFGINKNDKQQKQYALDLSEKLKISHLLDRFTQDISGGEKQRVALNRALAVKPDILLMDEPFSALDEQLRQDLYTDFIEFKKSENIPIILITHNLYEAEKLGDRIIYLDKGLIIDNIKKL